MIGTQSTEDRTSRFCRVARLGSSKDNCRHRAFEEPRNLLLIFCSVLDNVASVIVDNGGIRRSLSGSYAGGNIPCTNDSSCPGCARGLLTDDHTDHAAGISRPPTETHICLFCHLIRNSLLKNTNNRIFSISVLILITFLVQHV